MPQAVQIPPEPEFFALSRYSPRRILGARGAKTKGIFLNDHCRDTSLRHSDPG
jgi:hypothetical protein